jgi:hypothetical protein
MSRPNSGRASPTSAATNANILSNEALSESPASTNQSTPAVRPAPVGGSDGNDAVPTLRLDDIQSAIPFHDAPEGNESEYMLSISADKVLQFHLIAYHASLRDDRVSAGYWIAPR